MFMNSFVCKYKSKKLKKSCEYAPEISGVLYDYLSKYCLQSPYLFSHTSKSEVQVEGIINGLRYYTYL